MANLALFICAIFCLRYYIINTTDSLIICLIMNMTIVISIIGLIAYLVDGYIKNRPRIIPANKVVEVDSTLTETISQDNAELIRQSEEENRRRKEEQWAEIASYTKATFQRYLLRHKLIFCSIISRNWLVMKIISLSKQASTDIWNLTIYFISVGM